MKILLAAMAIVFTVSSTSAFAASTDETPAPPKELTDARVALDAKDYASAEAMLLKAVEVSPDNPDALNLLGFATRRQGKKDIAEDHYSKALSLNSSHKGALEYQGMLFIETGRIEQARENLKKLDVACLFGCDEFDRLEKAIETGQTY
jgi:Flp pilus assembly protein TadD